jgi:cysteine synthase
MKKNVFRGENGILEYLTPGSMGPTPLVELPEKLNPYHKKGVHIYVKLMQTLPLMNIKSLPAWYMLNAVPKSELKKIKNLVEYSSGNTVSSLAVLSRLFGIPNMHAIITPDVPENKQRLLKLLGVNLIISDGPASPDVNANFGGVWDASEMGKRPGWKNLHQYKNSESPRASGEMIGQELWGQLGEDLDALFISLGTGGTVLGTGVFLKNKNKNLFLVANSVKSGNSIPGPRGEQAVKKLHFPWWNVVDLELPIAERPAFTESLNMIRAGLFVGPSTGMQLAGIFELLKKKKLKLNKNKPTNIALVACDTMFPYIEEYFKILPELNKIK